MHRFQRIWFYQVDLKRPHTGYQTMSTIKGTLKHNRIGGNLHGGKRGEFRGLKI